MLDWPPTFFHTIPAAFTLGDVLLGSKRLVKTLVKGQARYQAHNTQSEQEKPDRNKQKQTKTTTHTNQQTKEAILLWSNVA